MRGLVLVFKVFSFAHSSERVVFLDKNRSLLS
jgi:hypothetical protein